jgi:hypothetical protein
MLKDQGNNEEAAEEIVTRMRDAEKEKMGKLKTEGV